VALPACKPSPLRIGNYLHQSAGDQWRRAHGAGATVGQEETLTVNGGVLHLAASEIRSPLIVTNGGVVISANDFFLFSDGGERRLLNASGSTFTGPVTVTNGGTSDCGGC